MRKLICAACAALLLVSLATPGFAADEPQEYVPEGNITLNVYNWGQYMADGSDESEDIIAAFEEKYPNIHVNYSTYDSNEVMYTKLASGGITVDVIFPSDYMVARMIEEDMLMELDFSHIPNYGYIDEEFKNMSYDPENKYSVPYTWGTVGIIYNSKYVDEEDVGSWDLLWNEKYKDKILMFDNSRDAFAIAAKLLKYSLNTTDEAELREIAAKLAEQEPLVQQYVMDQIFDIMENEEAYIAPYYVGDYMTMKENNDALEFYHPSEGFNLFVDAICIPKCAREKEAAELFINFLCDPEIMAANMDWVGYSVPASAALEHLDEETTSDPDLYPDEDVKRLGEAFNYQSPEVARFVEGLFLEARLGKASENILETWGVVAIAVVLAGVGIVYGIKRKKRQ